MGKPILKINRKTPEEIAGILKNNADFLLATRLNMGPPFRAKWCRRIGKQVREREKVLSYGSTDRENQGHSSGKITGRLWD